MYLNIFNRAGLFLIAVSLALPLTLASSVYRVQAATDAQLYITPASSSHQINTNKTFTIRLKTGTNTVNAVKAVVNFDASKFSSPSISSDSGIFFDAEVGVSGSTISIDVGKIPPPVAAGQDVVVRTFTLKATAGSGSGSVTVNQGSSGVYNAANNSNVLNSVGNATVNFTSPSSDGGGGGGGGGSTKPPSGGGSTPKPSDDNDDGDDKPAAEDPAKPKVSKKEVINIGFNTAKSTIELDRSARVVFEYGLDGHLALKLESNHLSKVHNLDLGRQLELLVPGRTYQYRVVVTDADGNQTVSETATFKTRGYTVKLLVLNDAGEPLKRLKLTLNSDPQNATTDEDGYVTFTDVAPGSHTLVAEVRGQKYEQTVEVDDPLNSLRQEVPLDAAPPEQTFTINMPFASAQPSLPIVWLIAGLGAVALVFVFIALWPKFRAGGFSFSRAKAGSGVDLSQGTFGTAHSSKTPAESDTTPKPTGSGYQAGEVIGPNASSGSTEPPKEPPTKS